MRKKRRRRRTRTLGKEFTIASGWFKEYGLVLAVILMAVASVTAFYYWFVGTLLPFP